MSTEYTKYHHCIYNYTCTIIDCISHIHTRGARYTTLHTHTHTHAHTHTQKSNNSDDDDALKCQWS